ncbi:MAG: methyltransferase domain-containing protein [Chitinispirillaceae bacterium]|nr:methyltransferase domain-containing protein [Chitinispirillaceae bacterium]
MKLNLGCGSHIPDGWTNVDYALGARLAKKPFFRTINKKIKFFKLDWNEKIYLHDLTRKLPWADSSIDTVYSSHTLEHFNKEDGRRLLSECQRVLRQGGILRIVVPDLMYEVTEYIEGRTLADDFIERLGVLNGTTNRTLKSKLTTFFQFPHKCMYDNSRLIEIFNEIGFDAYKKNAFDSDIEDIHVIELEGRTQNAVIVEGRKR